MAQGAIRAETARDRRERAAIETDLRDSPVQGRPLPHRPRNFRPDPDAGVIALGGPTAWMRRLHAIEQAVEEHERLLEEAWHELAAETSGAEFARRWTRTAAFWSFAQVNELIERHNRNFPAEARLPMDPRTRDFVKIGGKPYRRRRLDRRWILERFPAEVSAAAVTRSADPRRRRR